MNINGIDINKLPVHYVTDTHLIRVRKANKAEKSITHKSGIEITTDLIIVEPITQPRLVIGTVTPILMPDFTKANVNEAVLSKEDWDSKVKELTSKLL